MVWHKKKVRATNTSRGTVLGDAVRVAESSVKRAVGLLGERRLANGDGLLIMPSQGVHTVGMLFPIDVVFLDDDWKVIGMRRSMKPFRLTRLMWKAAAVLELPAGTLDETSTTVGDMLDFKRIEPAVSN